MYCSSTCEVKFFVGCARDSSKRCFVVHIYKSELTAHRNGEVEFYHAFTAYGARPFYNIFYLQRISLQLNAERTLRVLIFVGCARVSSTPHFGVRKERSELIAHHKDKAKDKLHFLLFMVREHFTLLFARNEFYPRRNLGRTLRAYCKFTLECTITKPRGHSTCLRYVSKGRLFFKEG
jgi:hypothetical protein